MGLSTIYDQSTVAEILKHVGLASPACLANPGKLKRATRFGRQEIKMRAALCLLSGLAILLGGCGRTTDTVAQFAENTHTATERLAFDSEQSNEQREERIDPYIVEVRHPPPLKLVERYETREGPDGLFVYDTEKHSIARLDNQAQAGLTLSQAQTAVEALSAADAKGLDH